MIRTALIEAMPDLVEDSVTSGSPIAEATNPPNSIEVELDCESRDDDESEEFGAAVAFRMEPVAANAVAKWDACSRITRRLHAGVVEDHIVIDVCTVSSGLSQMERNVTI